MQTPDHYSKISTPKGLNAGRSPQVLPKASILGRNYLEKMDKTAKNEKGSELPGDTTISDFDISASTRF